MQIFQKSRDENRIENLIIKFLDFSMKEMNKVNIFFGTSIRN